MNTKNKEKKVSAGQLVLWITLIAAIVGIISDSLNIFSAFSKSSANEDIKSNSGTSVLYLENIQKADSNLFEKTIWLTDKKYMKFSRSGIFQIIEPGDTLTIPISMLNGFLIYKFEKKLIISFKGNISSSVIYFNRINLQNFSIYLEQLKSAGLVLKIKTRLITFFSILGLFLIIAPVLTIFGESGGCLVKLISFLIGDYLILASTGNIPYLPSGFSI